MWYFGGGIEVSSNEAAQSELLVHDFPEISA